MKITAVETIVIRAPMLIEGDVLPKTSGVTRTSMETLLVRIATDEGVTGWGEGFGHRIYTATKAAIDSFIGPMCVGRDPTEINVLVDQLQRNLGGVGRMRSRRLILRCGTSRANWPDCRCIACSVVRYAEIFPPTQVCCVMEMCALLATTRSVRLNAVTASSSCMESPRRRSRPRVMWRGPIFN